MVCFEDSKITILLIAIELPLKKKNYISSAGYYLTQFLNLLHIVK